MAGLPWSQSEALGGWVLGRQVKQPLGKWWKGRKIHFPKASSGIRLEWSRWTICVRQMENLVPCNQMVVF